MNSIGSKVQRDLIKRLSYRLVEADTIKHRLIFSNDFRAKPIRIQAYQAPSAPIQGISKGFQLSKNTYHAGPKKAKPLQGLATIKGRGYVTRIRNRCAITGRGRGIIKEYGISRIVFKQLADQGKIPGLRKASW